jgi:antitoxin component HigA of HigAB toxin-antitoxin module
MASHNPPPIRSQAEFERALSEIEQLLETPRELSSEDRYFAYLLGQIADYHDSLPPERREASQERLEELEAHLKTYGLHWPHPQDGDRHWTPMLHLDLHRDDQGRR